MVWNLPRNYLFPWQPNEYLEVSKHGKRNRANWYDVQHFLDEFNFSNRNKNKFTLALNWRKLIYFKSEGGGGQLSERT